MLRRLPRLVLHGLLAASLTACLAAPAGAWPKRGPKAQAPQGGAQGGFQNISYADWTESEPSYRFYPGDEVEITVPSAPELSKTVTVQPDGRVAMPLIAPVMAADRTIPELQMALASAYSGQLLRPDVTVAVKTATPLKVFVMGEVDKPGVYDMPGDINAVQAVAQAGGFKTSANRRDVVIIRRGAGGRPMKRTADLLKGLKDPAHSDLVPLRRFDIVYVPRSGAAEAGLFIQQYVRDLIPIGFSYALGAQTVQ